MTLPSTHTLQYRQRGLSLIELMISLTLGLIILSALGGMLVSQTRIRAELDISSRVINNGTYAIELLADGLKLAGYYDALDPTTLSLPAAMPDPCSTASADIVGALRLHVQGYDAATSASVIGSPPSCVSSVTAGLKPGSDIVVIRRADTATAIDPTAATVGTHYLQASLCPNDPDIYRLGTNPAMFTLRQKNCLVSSTAPYALVRPFHVEIYFVDANHVAGDGIPTLKKVTLQNGAFSGAIPLVEGIEFLQVDYGLDANNDGVAESFSSCSACTVADWASVVSVKLSVVAKSQEGTRGYVNDKVFSLGSAGTVGPFNDAFKRNGYYQLVRLVNPAARRELP